MGTTTRQGQRVHGDGGNGFVLATAYISELGQIANRAGALPREQKAAAPVSRTRTAHCLLGAGEIQAAMDVVDAPQFSRRHVVGKCRLCLMHKIPELLCLWFKTDDFPNRNQAAETKRWG